MSRWLLGGSTPLRLGVQCLFAALFVLALQRMLAGDSGIHPLHAMMFGALSATAVVSGAVSRAMAGHARGLWLPPVGRVSNCMDGSSGRCCASCSRSPAR